MQQVADALAREHAASGVWRSVAELAARDAALPRQDLWGTPFAVRVRDGVVIVQSAGVDRRFDGDDDLVSDAGRPDAEPPSPPPFRVCPPSR